ncbi:MAG: hypothetical protein CMP61_09525 [Flavobacteriales bacterium]|nr:hypothetical protein [Flavobacteriales bacterium]|tara:strand:+ start:13522 stop:14646 length:1125 start_codon:yes stop_codon:yes gene_type:complete
MEKLKILHLVPNLAIGGAERICVDICESLFKNKVHVEIIIFDKKMELSLKDVKITFFNLLKNFSLRNHNTEEFKRFLQYVKSFNPNVVHTHLYSAELIWKLTKLKVPTVFHLHDNIKVFSPFRESFFRKSSYTMFYEKLWYKRLKRIQPTHFLTISRDTSCFIKKTLNIKRNEETLLPNAINWDKFYAPLENKSLSSIELITVGSLNANKDQKFLIEVVRQLKDFTKKSINLNIVGDGPLRGELEAYANQLGLRSQVNFVGKVGNPEDYLKKANIYVHSAISEAFGLVLVEAMASGLPVYSTDGGGNRDLIENDFNGRIYTKRDPKKMARDISELFDNKLKYSELAKNAQDLSRGYKLEIYTKKLIELYIYLIK